MKITIRKMIKEDMQQVQQVAQTSWQHTYEGINNIDGAKEILVNVEKDNEVGINFYKASGFEVISEFDDDFDGHILKTVRMVLKV